MAYSEKDALLAQIRFAFKKPIVLAEDPPEESDMLEYWIDRFIDQEVTQYSPKSIELVFSNHQRAKKLLLIYLEKQGVIADSGVDSQEKDELQAMLED